MSSLVRFERVRVFRNNATRPHLIDLCLSFGRNLFGIAHFRFPETPLRVTGSSCAVSPPTPKISTDLHFVPWYESRFQQRFKLFDSSQRMEHNARGESRTLKDRPKPDTVSPILKTQRNDTSPTVHVRRLSAEAHERAPSTPHSVSRKIRWKFR